MTDDVARDDDGGGFVASLSQVDLRRSLILSSIGAIMGLLFAGFALFTAQGTRTSAVSAENAAMVNNVPILRSDLIAQLAALHNVSLSEAKPALRRKVLDDMIREELHVQRGIELGMANDDIDVRSALFSASEAQVAADAMTAQPTDDELRDYFKRHVASYASEGLMELKEFVVPPARTADAGSIVARLRAGATPASLGLQSSGRVDDGIEFYFAAKIHLGDRLFRVARGLNDGQVSDAIPQGNDARILIMVHNERPVANTYEEVMAQVRSDFMRDKIAVLQAGDDRFLRKRADVKIAADLQ